MPNYRGKVCRITWGAGFANTLNVGYPLDVAMAYGEPRDGSDTVQYRSGIEDAWSAGTDRCLEGAIRYIPHVDGVTPEGNSATGWDGAAGVDAFLEWARAKNVFRFYPDIVGAPATYFSLYLVDPMKGKPDNEEDYTRRLNVKFRTSDGTRVDGY